MKQRLLYTILILIFGYLTGQASGIWLSRKHTYRYLPVDNFDTKFSHQNAHILDLPVHTSVNAQGAAIVDIPLALPNVENGFSPSLSLHYNSMRQETMFRNDWSLSGLSEIRRVPKNMFYDGVVRAVDEDAEVGTGAFALNGLRMIELSRDLPRSISYQTVTGNIQVKAHIIQRQDNTTNNELRYVYSHFEVWYPNGHTAIFGFPEIGRNRSQTHFPITSVSDRLGNRIYYDYIFTYNEYRIRNIRFGRNGVASVDFHYENINVYFERVYFDEPVQCVFAGGLTANTACCALILSAQDAVRSKSGVLTRISVSYNGVQLHYYTFEYSSDGNNIYLFSVQLLSRKEPAECTCEVCIFKRECLLAANPSPICGFKFECQFEPEPIDPLVLQNDTAYFSMPVRFRYKTNNRYSSYKTTESLIVNSEVDVRSIRGVFGSNKKQGIVVFPNMETYRANSWRLTVSPTDSIAIKPNLDRPEILYLETGEGFVDILLVDLDGRPGDEIVRINNVIERHGQRYRDVLIFSIYTINDADTLELLDTWTYRTNFEIYTDVLFQKKKPAHKKFFAGDFSGTGINHILAVSGFDKSGCREIIDFFAEMYNLTNGYLVYRGYIFEHIDMSGNPFPRSSDFPIDFPWDGPSLEACNSVVFIPGNFTGTGKMSFLYMPSGGRQAVLVGFEFEPGAEIGVEHLIQMGNTTLEPRFENSVKLKNLGESFHLVDRGGDGVSFFTGDFNGDGKTDIFIQAHRHSGHFNFNHVIYLSNGKQLESNLQLTNVLSNTNTSLIAVEDMNSDGYDDLILRQTRTDNGRTIIETLIVYLSAEGIIGVEPIQQAISTGSFSPANKRRPTSEISKNELVFADGKTLTRIARGTDMANSTLLTAVKSGFGTVTEFQYKRIDNDNVYTPSEVAPTYPFYSMPLVTTVVSKTRIFNDDLLVDVRSYTYADGVMHHHGLGFRGFGKITMHDSIRNQTVTRTFDPFNFGVPKRVDSPTASIVTDYHVTVHPNKIKEIRLRSVTQTDKLRETQTTTSFSHDRFGNLTRETVDFGNDLRVITNNVFDNFTTRERFQLGQLRSSSVTRQLQMDEFTELPAGPPDFIGIPELPVFPGLPGRPPMLIVPGFAPLNDTSIGSIGFFPGHDAPFPENPRLPNFPGDQGMFLPNSSTVRVEFTYCERGLPISRTSFYNDRQVSVESNVFNNLGELTSTSARPFSADNSLTTTLRRFYDIPRAEIMPLTSDMSIHSDLNDRGQIELLPPGNNIISTLRLGRITQTTDPLERTTSSLRNTLGRIERTTDIHGNSTFFEYDAFGRVVRMLSPFGYDAYRQLGLRTDKRPGSDNQTASFYLITDIESRWVNLPDDAPDSSIPENAFYAVTTRTVDNNNELTAPETTVYFDRLGREIRTAQLRFDGSRLKIDRQFDQRGRLHKVSLPFKGDAPTHWNVYHYDEFDRITKIEHASGRTDTWAYSGNSITSTIDGMKSTQRFNAAGQLVEVTDGGGTITYTYRPDGQIREIDVNGVITSFTYDLYGRQTSINDPSAGIQTYEFDSAGNLRSQTDARGQSIRMYYDEFHRLIRKEMPEFTTEYFYNEHGAISSIVSTNHTSRHFVYDSFGRLIEETEFASEEKWLTTRYNYSGAFLTGISFESSTDGNIVTENYFFQNGFLTEIKLNNETSIWRLTSENHMGQPTSLRTGVLSRTYEYDEFGFPVARKSTAGGNVVFHQTYQFNPATGNLMFRGDGRNQGFEHFTYDTMNRLTSSRILSTGGRILSSRSFAFTPIGNIDEKSDVGLFYYNNPDRPFQLTEVISENRPAQFRTNQTVAYTSFQRPSMIHHGDYIALFTYNASGDRVRMQTEHIKAGELQDRFYIGSRFEVDVIEHSAILWLGGDAYSAPAALKRQFGGTWNIYYICRDYLGSIHVVTDEQGVIVQEISFDPWGRLRNAQTHQLYAIGNEPRLFLGNRGFTGHEHLQWFGLINMNARLYDPLVGRFLSPDPFVQAPGFTQSFNRYSYAWNNPLKFIDPSGETNFRWNEEMQWWTAGNGRPATFSEFMDWQLGINGGNRFFGGSGDPFDFRFNHFPGGWNPHFDGFGSPANFSHMPFGSGGMTTTTIRVRAAALDPNRPGYQFVVPWRPGEIAVAIPLFYWVNVAKIDWNNLGQRAWSGFINMLEVGNPIVKGANTPLAIAKDLAVHFNKWGYARHTRLLNTKTPVRVGVGTVLVDLTLFGNAIYNNDPWGWHAYNVVVGGISLIPIYGTVTATAIDGYVQGGRFFIDMVNWINTVGERMVFNHMFNGRW